MCREEKAYQDKRAFNQAFFDLKMEIQSLNLHADKAAKDRSGSVMYVYCSEKELLAILDPLLTRHGFAMLSSQENFEGMVTVKITLIHRDGHEHAMTYSVRPGATNAVKDATAADSGATTTAWRHLVIKMFGLKSRIIESDDPRNLGDRITTEQAEELKRRVMETESDEHKFLAFAGVRAVSGEVKLEHYQSIMSGRYAELDAFLAKKEQRGR